MTGKGQEGCGQPAPATAMPAGSHLAPSLLPTTSAQLYPLPQTSQTRIRKPPWPDPALDITLETSAVTRCPRGASHPGFAARLGGVPEVQGLTRMGACILKSQKGPD